MTGTLVQLNVSNGGMPKLSVPTVRVTRDGLAGDWQKVRKYHGGPDRAVCLFSEELYAWLREQGVKGVVNGSIGENFTTRGIDLMSLNAGDRLRAGDQVVIELTDVREPCRQLKMWDARFPKLILGRSGWLARVVVEGEVKAGDEIRRMKRSVRSVSPVMKELVYAATRQGHGPLLRMADAAMDWRKVNDAAAVMLVWLASRARRRAAEYVDARDPLDLGRRPAKFTNVDLFLRYCPSVGRTFQLNGRDLDFRPDVAQKDRWAIEDFALQHGRPTVNS
jgi:MOSC domain-containing protein YiiM